MKFDFIELSKMSGRICMLLSILIAMNIIVMELMGNPYTGIIGVSIEYFVYGIFLYGMGTIVDNSERHYMEMKYFRKHFIEQDSIKRKENKDA